MLRVLAALQMGPRFTPLVNTAIGVGIFLSCSIRHYITSLLLRRLPFGAISPMPLFFEPYVVLPLRRRLLPLIAAADAILLRFWRH